MYPDRNPLKEKLEQDKCIHGLYIQTASPDNVEMAAAAGYDYVILDLEHGSFGYSEMLQMIRAAEASGIAPVVRVSQNCASEIRKALEAGAVGVYVPDIQTAEQAEAAVAAVKFRSAEATGLRGACPTVRSARSRGASEWPEYVDWSNRNTVLSLLIESQKGLDNLDKILQIPGIDTIIMGRFDLAQEMGLKGDRYGKEMSEKFELFADQCKRAGVPYLARLSSLNADKARAEYDYWIQRGARIFNLGSDRELIARSFSQALHPLTPPIQEQNASGA
ncbi:aldolase [Pollutimonas subterranea]|uniref:Aldolase n=1 Tax=Pollutimonas subterranea TaxID=2045210 RepID=A0A2N4U4F1_9BURK|nr:aldolase/citrate lyase family protein [Pollutimonas subterranea]PLC49898.1 aldolase [Pollutimonas subterranea]